MMQAFAYTHILPTKQLFLAVIPPAAFTLAADVPAGKVIEVKQDSDTPIAIRGSGQGRSHHRADGGQGEPRPVCART